MGHEAFESTMNGSNLEITFIGNDNLLNAIYSRNDKVSLTNVTYWGANGIENTGASAITPLISDKEAGQNITVKGVVNGNVIDMVKVTDADGKIVFEDVDSYCIIVRHDDDFYYSGAETIFVNNQSSNITVVVDGVSYPAELVNGTATVKTNATEPVVKKDTFIEVESAFTRVANDYYAGERGALFYAILKDSDGNVLANKTVSIAVNGPIYNVTTDEQGRAGLQVNFMVANVYTYALSFKGDDEYNAAPLASSKLTITKKAMTISASSKSFKVKAKKTIRVTLKAAKNPYNGKVYLKSGKKVTLKVHGKTYTAKANAKGVAKFTVKLTKKGKYAAKIKFAGDKTYKSARKSIKITVK